MNVKRSLVHISSGLFVIVFLGILISIIWGERILPKENTKSIQITLEYRIHDYFELHKRLPKALADLPVQIMRDNAICDGWNRAMHFSCTGTVVYLRSYGKDGVVGGKGDNEDIEHRFDLCTQ